MTDKVIRVNVTSSKSQKVTVSSSKVANEITASPDTSAYYSRLAKNWAIAEGLVENIDYSSKHYAQESKASADMSKTYETATQENYNMFMEASVNANSELQTNRDGALADIEGAKTSAIDSLNSIKDENISTIESKANEEIENLNKEVEQGKDEIKDTIDGIKVLTTLEIGDIGIAPLGIDETKGLRRYLNGQVIIQEQYVQFTEKVKSAVALYPSLACTESEWQTTATMTVGGQVGKFVVDDDAGTIRLPKIIMPIQGLTDLSKLGEIVEAGLPNITGNTTGHSNESVNGAFKDGSILYNFGPSHANYGYKPISVSFDASRTSSVYGNSNTVQQEQIQYPYFIQVATGAEVEDNIINEIELNNPYSFGDSKYSPVALNNLSWLKSEGQYNSKIVYPAYYEWLLKIYNGVEVVDGVSVKLTTEEYTDYDWVLNTADETFRLPLLDGSESIVDYSTSLGLEYTTTNRQFPATGVAYFGYKGASNTSAKVYINDIEFGLNGSSASNINGQTAYIVSKNDVYRYEALSNGQYGALYPYKGNGSLYFYVGETVQNANLINAGRIEEKLVDKVDTNASNFTAEGKSLISGFGMPSNKYINLTLGASGTSYTAPANGYVLIRKFSNAIAQHLTAFNNSGIGDTKVSSIASQALWVWFPVKKGEVFTITYNAGGNVEMFRFIYAQGEV